MTEVEGKKEQKLYLTYVQTRNGLKEYWYPYNKKQYVKKQVDGRKKVVTEEQKKLILEMYCDGSSKKAISEDTGLSLFIINKVLGE